MLVSSALVAFVVSLAVIRTMQLPPIVYSPHLSQPFNMSSKDILQDLKSRVEALEAETTLTPSQVVVSDASGNLTTAARLSVALGGTNSSAALANTKLIVSAGGAMVEGTSSTAPSFANLLLTDTTLQFSLGNVSSGFYTLISSVAPTLGLQTLTIPNHRGYFNSGTGSFVTSKATNPFITAPTTTYTPTLTDSASNTFTGITGSSTFVKDGDWIHIHETFSWTGKGAAVAGNSIRVGIPINAHTTVNNAALTVGYFTGIVTGAATLVSAIVNGGAFANLYLVDQVTGAARLVLVSDLAAAGDLSLTGSYRWA